MHHQCKYEQLHISAKKPDKTIEIYKNVNIEMYKTQAPCEKFFS